MKLRHSTKKYLESELFDYKDMNKHLNQLREEIANPWQPQDENIGGGRSNRNVSVTERTATLLVTDKRLLQMQRMSNAIEKVYNDGTDLQKEFMDIYYFQKNRKLTIEGIAQELNYSRSTILDNKRIILCRLADELGIMR